MKWEVGEGEAGAEMIVPDFFATRPERQGQTRGWGGKQGVNPGTEASGCLRTKACFRWQLKQESLHVLFSLKELHTAQCLKKR